MILPPQDGKKFFEIALPLLAWVKKRRDKSKTATWKNKRFDAAEARILWNAIWENPTLLERYLKQRACFLPEETKRVLSEWRNEFVPGPFIVERYLKEGTVFISVWNGQVYLVSGITSEIEELLPETELPRQAQTALIPFKGHLIYDGAMQAKPEPVGAEGAKVLNQTYQDAKRLDRVIRRLPSDVPPLDRDWSRRVSRLFLSEDEKKGMLSPEEFRRKLDEMPEIHIISKQELSVLNRMLDKSFRSEEDWETIQGILMGAHVFTFVPPRPMRVGEVKIRSVESVLCENHTLMVFTSMEKCQDYIRKLFEKQATQRYAQVDILACEAVFQIARKRKMQVFIDNPGNTLQQFFSYNGQTERLSVGFRLS